jgi:hypothetical protein
MTIHSTLDLLSAKYLHPEIHLFSIIFFPQKYAVSSPLFQFPHHRSDIMKGASAQSQNRYTSSGE